MATRETQPTATQVHMPLWECIDANASVLAATRRMQDENTHHLVLLKSGRIVGIVSDCDLIVRCAAAYRRPSSTHVYEIMSAAIFGACGAKSLRADTAQTIQQQDRLTRSVAAGENWEDSPAVGSGPLV